MITDRDPLPCKMGRGEGRGPQDDPGQQPAGHPRPLKWQSVRECASWDPSDSHCRRLWMAQTAIEERVAHLEGRVDGFDSRFDALERRFDVVEQRFDALREELG